MNNIKVFVLMAGLMALFLALGCAPAARRTVTAGSTATKHPVEPPAALVAAVSRAPATHPMPVWTIGYCVPKRSQAAVWSPLTPAPRAGAGRSGRSSR